MKWILLLALALNGSGSALALIESNTTFSLDLTDAKEASAKAKWSDPTRNSCTSDGLGWGSRDDEGSRDVWVETEPMAIGLSWRPTSIASIKATVDRPGTSGLLYARYSSDGKRWTTWQHMERITPAGREGLTEGFQSQLRVPYRDSARYQELRMEYARREDVVWSSDEEALVKEIVKRDPKFFEKTTPFIGYVQFLYEAQLRGGQRMKGLNVEVTWWLGGKHLPPKEAKTRTGRDVAWRFKAP